MRGALIYWCASSEGLCTLCEYYYQIESKRRAQIDTNTSSIRTGGYIIGTLLQLNGFLCLFSSFREGS